ncbi:MAG: alanine racemase, partial [Clostridiales bacterium]|nr:alanine racemase [Clostridiales bacterium]
MICDPSFDRAWVEIDLDALKCNIQEINKLTGGKPEIMAMVKADAYGHGAVEIASAALRAGAGRLAVICLDEALE